MSIRKRFNETFGLKDDVEVERRRFVERVNHIIFHRIDTTDMTTFDYITLFELLCIELGVNAVDVPQRKEYSQLYDTIVRPAEIRTLTKDDFRETLSVLCALYLHLEPSSNSNEGRKWLSERIKFVLSLCSCDIGIRWKEGFFYPAGAEELDKPLIEETLTWLNDYPNERKDYRRALECYLGDESLSDVIKNCYSAIEGVSREVIGNQKTLDNNKDDLLRKINLSVGWKPIVASYINYAHNFRHASEQRHEITKQETEGYLYMTGLIIRLIIESK